MLVQTTEGLVSKCGFELQYFFWFLLPISNGSIKILSSEEKKTR